MNKYERSGSDGNSYIMDLAEGSEERPQSVLVDEGRQAADENRRVVWIRGGQLLAIGPNEIRQYRARLSVMLPRLLR